MNENININALYDLALIYLSLKHNRKYISIDELVNFLQEKKLTKGKTPKFTAKTHFTHQSGQNTGYINNGNILIYAPVLKFINKYKEFFKVDFEERFLKKNGTY